MTTVHHVAVASAKTAKGQELIKQLVVSGFKFANVNPVPSVLEVLDEFHVLAMALHTQQWPLAFAVASELGLPGYSTTAPSFEESRALLKSIPDWSGRLRQANKAIQHAGHYSLREWKLQNWGSSTDIQAAQVDSLDDSVVSLRFEDEISRRDALLTWCLANRQDLAVSFFVVDEGLLRQEGYFSCALAAGESTVPLTKQVFNSEDEFFASNWLAKPPPSMNLQT